MKYTNTILVSLFLSFLNLAQAQISTVIPDHGLEAMLVSVGQLEGKNKQVKLNTSFWRHINIDEWEGGAILYTGQSNNNSWSGGLEYSQAGAWNQSSLLIAHRRRLSNTFSFGLVGGTTLFSLPEYSSSLQWSIGIDAFYKIAPDHGFRSLLKIPISTNHSGGNTEPMFRIRYTFILSDATTVSFSARNNLTGHIITRLCLQYQPSLAWCIEWQQGISPASTGLTLTNRQFAPFESYLFGKFQYQTGMLVGIGFTYTKI